MTIHVGCTCGLERTVDVHEVYLEQPATETLLKEAEEFFSTKCSL